jgi:hypothetical protein
MATLEEMKSVIKPQVGGRNKLQPVTQYHGAYEKPDTCCT